MTEQTTTVPVGTADIGVTLSLTSHRAVRVELRMPAPVREALLNVEKHAQATSVDVELAQRCGRGGRARRSRTNCWTARHPGRWRRSTGPSRATG